jgi:hypothetical protein
MNVWKIGFMLALTACIRTAPQPVAQYWVSSDSSQYSPVAHFLVHATAVGAGLSIAIDSASIAIPGAQVPNDSVLLIDQLRYGERAHVPDIQLLVPVAAKPPDGPLWMIFRISGNTVELAAPLEAAVSRIIDAQCFRIRISRTGSVLGLPVAPVAVRDSR